MAYNSVITNIGLAKINNQPVTGQPIVLTHIALGDGNGSAVTPTQSAMALVHEVYRGQINRLFVPDDDPAQIIAELVVLPQTGGWTVREVGIFDEDGDMIVFASHPAIYKPMLAEGSGMDYTVAVHALIGNDVNVTLKIDPGVVIATRKYVDDKDTAHNANAGAHAAAFAAHNADPDAHNKYDLPWIPETLANVTRTSDTALTISGDVRSAYPQGKRLRFNSSDTYLCRVFGAPTYANSVTTIAVWFDVATTIPATISKLERSRLMPQDTANGSVMTGSEHDSTLLKLMQSYCCGSYIREG